MEREAATSTTGVKRSRVEDDGGDNGGPSAKRQKTRSRAATAKRQPAETLSGSQLLDAASASVPQRALAALEREVDPRKPLHDKTAEATRGRAQVPRTRRGGKSQTSDPVTAAAAPALRRSERIAEREIAPRSAQSLEERVADNKAYPARSSRRQPSAKTKSTSR